MIDHRSYPESAPFPFIRNGHANRRDDDAIPRVLVLEIAPDGRTARLHFSGEPNVRVAHTVELAMDHATVSGMDPVDAFKVGCACG